MGGECDRVLNPNHLVYDPWQNISGWKRRRDENGADETLWWPVVCVLSPVLKHYKSDNLPANSLAPGGGRRHSVWLDEALSGEEGRHAPTGKSGYRWRTGRGLSAMERHPNKRRTDEEAGNARLFWCSWRFLYASMPMIGKGHGWTEIIDNQGQGGGEPSVVQRLHQEVVCYRRGGRKTRPIYWRLSTICWSDVCRW